ncbi:cysteine proteinase [Massarina eburnea CBS 473.64]|uniref:ubiquitinyl hydrolase 1 n=1 Tax=Massarina eburnea CBS 473.64 TaxID=1395130 RepID=A0A6A6SAX1_9PLEO|nr:cysteine proteinase [Massarina eburnea CBS 473.64]
MADAGYVLPDEELAQLQKLSSDFEPETTGPLVGERQSSAAITTEYANADPVYRVKTAALPSKYAYFRTCRGDGHCGWRAIAFTYLEALVREANVGKFEEEEARLMSINNLFNNVGINYELIIDFAEEMFDLLHKLAHSVSSNDGNADAILLQAFNDMGTSLSIITYIKFLASAWVQAHPADFEAFITTGDVKTYCSLSIEPSQCELDYVAVGALSAALIKPAGFAFEIMYLDRSAGEEVNATVFSQPTDQNGMLLPNPPTIRLLYRPGHYDILYKAEDFPPPVQQQPIQVALANPYNDSFIPSESSVDIMAMIPGMYSTSFGHRWPSVPYEFDASPTPQAQVTPVQPYTPTPASAAPVNTSRQDYMPVHASHQPNHSNTGRHGLHLEGPPVTLPIHSLPPPPVSIERGHLTLERGGPFRPSMYELEQINVPSFQTSIFKNSQYNTAHYMNPDFQPEAWSPDTEYGAGHKGKHKPPAQ